MQEGICCCIRTWDFLCLYRDLAGVKRVFSSHSIVVVLTGQWVGLHSTKCSLAGKGSRCARLGKVSLIPELVQDEYNEVGIASKNGATTKQVK